MGEEIPFEELEEKTSTPPVKETAGDFVAQQKMPAITETAIAIPPGMQLIEEDKLQKLLEFARQYKELAHIEHEKYKIVTGDVQALVNQFAFLMDELGFMKIIKSKEEIDFWNIAPKIMGMIKKIFRSKDDPNSVYMVAAREVSDFIQKYSDPKNFDENGQFKFPG